MAKKKKSRKSKRRYYGKKGKKGGSRKHKTPVAASFGGLKTAWDVGNAGTFTDIKTTVMNPNMTTAKVTTVNAFERIKTKGGPLMLGMSLSYGDKVPIVGKLYRPIKRKMDALVRSVLGKGYKF